MSAIRFFTIIFFGTAIDSTFAATSDTGLRMTDTIKRQIRALAYPEESEMGIFFALAIPLDDPVSTKAISVAFFFEANYALPTNFEPKRDDDGGGEVLTAASRNFTSRKRRLTIDRKTVYSMLESKLDSIGLHGSHCLLRSICETARLPIHRRNGLLGDLLRILLTPSSSGFEDLHPRYKAAEDVNMSLDCAEIYPRCTFGIYDYITRQF